LDGTGGEKYLGESEGELSTDGAQEMQKGREAVVSEQWAGSCFQFLVSSFLFLVFVSEVPGGENQLSIAEG
jgi:hypothetical protein